MSKALTPVNRKHKVDADPDPQRLSKWTLGERFPSYFGNFGIFNWLLAPCALASLTKRCLRAGHEFHLMTAFMAIV
jgi:hypothetical protein